MNIVAAGGSGFIGRHLRRWLVQCGHRVTILSRDPSRVRSRCSESVVFARWLPRNGSPASGIAHVLVGAQTVINLSGEVIAARRWTGVRIMVLGRNDGALPQMALPFRLFLGGRLGPGDRTISWIHCEEVSRLIGWGLDNRQICGPVNAVALLPVSMSEFCRILDRALRRLSWLPLPEFLLEFGLGELATVMTAEQWIEPMVAHRHGFEFRYPDLESVRFPVPIPAPADGPAMRTENVGQYFPMP